MKTWICFLTIFLIPGLLLPASAQTKQTGLVKVAAVQINGYDKGDLPRANFNPAADYLPYIERAAKDGAQLVVFPEYVLGHIKVPGPQTQLIADAAREAKIYVIIGCWEEYDDGRFANTALLFDRTGNIAGKYHKTHAAIDHFDGARYGGQSFKTQGDPKCAKSLHLHLLQPSFSLVAVMMIPPRRGIG